MRQATKLKKVVILGGGFAGLVTARHLVKAGVLGELCEVTVIDAADAHVYTPWLYEAASCALDGETKATKARMLDAMRFVYADLPGFQGVRFVQKRIQGVELNKRQVIVEGKRLIPYDLLVVALGAEPNYFGVPGLPEHALTLKRSEDAGRIHDTIEKLIDKATSREPKYLVIAGAGPNGIEFVSELAHTLRSLERRDKLQFGAVKITLVDPALKMFGVLPESLRLKAVSRLEKLGIELRPGLRVSEVGKSSVKAFTVTGKSQDAINLPADLCIWSAGVRVNTLAMSLPFKKDDRGRIVLENTYAVPGQLGVFAAGDCAALVNPHTGQPDPQSAQVAHYQAYDLARNLIRFMHSEPLKAARLPKRWAFFSALGGKRAAGTFAGIKFWGYSAYWMRRFADLYYFLALLPPWAALTKWLHGVRLYGQNDR